MFVSLTVLVAKRAELVADALVSSLEAYGSFLPRILRIDKGTENTSIARIIERFDKSKYYAGVSMRNQPIEAAWASFSLNVSSELQARINAWEKQKILALDEPANHLVIQMTAQQYLTSKCAFFIERRDYVKAPGQALTRAEQFKQSLKQAYDEGHVARDTQGLLRQVFLEEMEDSAAAGNEVYGPDAALWSTTAATLAQAEGWRWLRPSHVRKLHAHVGPFTMPSVGAVADPYELVLERYYKGRAFLRSLYSEKNANAVPYF